MAQRRRLQARTHPDLDVTPRLEAGRQRIQSYGGGGFKIAGQAFRGSVIVLPDQVLPWPCFDVAALTRQDFDAVRETSASIEILLLGCGPRAILLQTEIGDALRRSGITLESMDTGAACRTFNVLLHEDRRVAAALIAVD